MKYVITFTLLFSLWACSSSNDKNSDTQWITLFDGTNTDALRGYKLDEFPSGIWNVNEGALVANPDTTNIDIITKERFENFRLEYEWAVDTAANSGVFFHVQEKMDMESGNGNSPNWLENFEIQILDDEHFYDTLSVRSAGALYDLIAPSNKSLSLINDFNKAILQHNDGLVEHWLNGLKVLEFKIGSKELNELIASSKFSENPHFGTDTEGHIMFQHHGQRVYFRKIRVKRL